MPATYSVHCTHLEDTMKTFIAVLLLSACATYAFAEELQMPFNKAVFQFLDERHDEKMAQVLRDNGLPEDTLPAADERADPPAFLVSMRRASIFDKKWIC